MRTGYGLGTEDDFDVLADDDIREPVPPLSTIGCLQFWGSRAPQGNYLLAYDDVWFAFSCRHALMRLLEADEHALTSEQLADLAIADDAWDAAADSIIPLLRYRKSTYLRYSVADHYAHRYVAKHEKQA